MHDKTEYDLKDLELPRLAGGTLRIFVKMMESPLTRPLLMKRLCLRGLKTPTKPSRNQRAEKREQSRLNAEYLQKIIP